MAQVPYPWQSNSNIENEAPAAPSSADSAGTSKRRQAPEGSTTSHDKNSKRRKQPRHPLEAVPDRNLDYRHPFPDYYLLSSSPFHPNYHLSSSPFAPNRHPPSSPFPPNQHPPSSPYPSSKYQLSSPLAPNRYPPGSPFVPKLQPRRVSTSHNQLPSSPPPPYSHDPPGMPFPPNHYAPGLPFSPHHYPNGLSFLPRYDASGMPDSFNDYPLGMPLPSNKYPPGMLLPQHLHASGSPFPPKADKKSAGYPPERHVGYALDKPVGNALKRPVEVISLLDDDYNQPPTPLAQTHSQVNLQNQRRDPGLDMAGSYHQPFEIDCSPGMSIAAKSQITNHETKKRTTDSNVLRKECTDTTAKNIGLSSYRLQAPTEYTNTAAKNINCSPDRLQAPIPLPAPNTSVTDIVPISEPTLCGEQSKLVDIILSGANVFYTGGAGCGKSTVLKAFVKKYKERGVDVKIIAPTGRAALDINGSTTWTYAGWTPDSHKKPLKRLKTEVWKRSVRERIQETTVLVIDEISMVENLHLERLNAVMESARQNDEAFGGVQIIVTGDFCQLPPVTPFQHCIDCGSKCKAREVNRVPVDYTCRPCGKKYYDRDKWAFRSEAWEEANFVHVNLQKIHRQSDTPFVGILNNLRMGIQLTEAQMYLLKNHDYATKGAVKLFATLAEVKRVNDEKFATLPSTARDYKCHDHFECWDEDLRNKGAPRPHGSMLGSKNHRFETKVQLKIGMRVVLQANLDLGKGLVNGSQGTIVRFEDYDPAKMPMAATRERKRAGAYLPGVPVFQGELAGSKEIRLKEYAEKMTFRAWPVVQFLNGPMRTIYAECTVNELGDGDGPKSLLSRTQIPLMAAWAMTTHKCQGMTLKRVEVNLANSWEQGQAYVALSRARTLDGLKVVALWDPTKQQPKGDPDVKEFLRQEFGIGG